MASCPLVLFSRIIALSIPLTEKVIVVLFGVEKNGTRFVCDSELFNTVVSFPALVIVT